MSAFDAAFSTALRPSFLSAFGREVRYFRPMDLAGRRYTAVVGRVHERETASAVGAGGGGGEAIERSRTATLSIEDAPDPSTEDEVQVDGERWSIQLVERRGHGLVRLRLVRTVRAQTARRGYTIRR